MLRTPRRAKASWKKGANKQKTDKNASIKQNVYVWVDTTPHAVHDCSCCGAAVAMSMAAKEATTHETHNMCVHRVCVRVCIAATLHPAHIEDSPAVTKVSGRRKQKSNSTSTEFDRPSKQCRSLV